MMQLQPRVGVDTPVTFNRQGTGTLFYLMRLRYVPAGLVHEAMNQGISVERKY
jgi:hypothetical protein